MNKTILSKICLLALFFILPAALFAQIEFDASQMSGMSFGDYVVGTIVGLLILVGPLFMIGHMLYVLYETKQLNKEDTVEHFTDIRSKKNLPGQSSTDENNQCRQLLDDADALYTAQWTEDDGTAMRGFSKMREVMKAHKLVKEAAKLMPTEPSVVSYYNEHKACLYANMKRSFFSSWKLIILCLIIAVGMGFVGEASFWKNFFTIGAFFWVPCIVYYLSGQVPQFMINKKAARSVGNGWFVTALIGLGIGAMGSGQTVRTKWSDGSVTEDNSSHVIALVIGLVVLFVVALTIYLWALVNYLRNYVFYI